MRLARDTDGNVILQIPLDDRTVAWLAAVADMHHAAPEHIAAAIIRDVREDDELNHLPPPRFEVVGGTDTLN